MQNHYSGAINHAYTDEIIEPFFPLSVSAHGKSGWRKRMIEVEWFPLLLALYSSWNYSEG